MSICLRVTFEQSVNVIGLATIRKPVSARSPIKCRSDGPGVYIGHGSRRAQSLVPSVAIPWSYLFFSLLLALPAVHARQRQTTTGARRSNGSRKRPRSWSHRFICLSSNIATRWSNPDRSSLDIAGLGKSIIEIENFETWSSSAFATRLYEHYPKLKSGGGFEFMRLLMNSRTLQVIYSRLLRDIHQNF